MAKPPRYGYVYHFIFIRPTDGREFHYIGQHVGDKVDRRYFGSGHRLHQLYNKYGRDGNVRRFGLLWCHSRQELDFSEILSISFAKELYGRDCINLCYGGDGGRKARSSVEKQQISLRAFYASAEGRALRDHLSACNIGTVVSAETRRKISILHKGRKRSGETCAKIGKLHKGRKRSEETKQRLVESWAKREQVSCPHCDKIGSLNLMHRWHFDNCKAFTGVSRIKPETLEKRKRTDASKPPMTCPHCGKVGSGSNMVRYHFDNCETLTGISKVSQETRDKFRKLFTGKKHTPETIAAMSAAKKGKKHSPEHRANLAEANRARAQRNRYLV